jgi:ligand-binding SRPBCC domain-containing protein
MSLLASTSFHLRVWTRFLVPPDEVWALKTDPAALAAEFRPWMHLLSGDAQAVGQALGEARPGSFRAWLVPPGVPWPIEVVEVQPGVRYVDRSANLLFSAFEHEHLFQPTPDGCRYVDAVSFTPRLPASKATAIALERLFVHRHRVAARRLPSDPQATGVAVLRSVVPPASEHATA